MSGMVWASLSDNKIKVPSVYCLYSNRLMGCCNKIYLSRKGGILMDSSRKKGDVWGVMPCVANSQSMLKSLRSTPGIRRPSAPKTIRSRAKESQLDVKRPCLCRHIWEKSVLHSRNKAASAAKAWGGYYDSGVSRRRVPTGVIFIRSLVCRWYSWCQVLIDRVESWNRDWKPILPGKLD